MSLSSIKDLWQKFSKSDEINPSKSLTPEDYGMISDYMSQKFPESREIFIKFNSEDFYSFIKKSTFVEYNENDLIYAKHTLCDTYLFILHGDMDFFDKKPGEESGENNILIKTISAGKIYGHLVKENYKYDIKARSNISLISINKKVFDDLIITINKSKNVNKFKFIKKFFPKIRLYSDEIINNVLQYFERVKFNKHSKIFLKDEYNEYVYLIIKGQVAICVRPKSLFHLDRIDKNLVTDELINEVNSNLYKNDYIMIEQLSRGEVFGINSALKGQKSFYTVVTLTDNVEVYRILKGNILFYFGGSGGILPVALKALGTLQDDSCHLKIDYLKSIDFTKKEIQNKLKEKFCLLFDGGEKLRKNKKIKRDENYFIIDENSIKNNLFEAWKNFENLGSKISEFKSKLLGDSKSTKKKNIFGEEIGEKDSSSNSLKDFKKVSGDATNRVVSRRLNMGLNSNQLKSLDKLNMICGVKKNGEENIKKVANITSKLEGGGRSKLMSFMRNDDSINSLEGFSKRANEKDRKMHEEEAKKVEEEKKLKEEKEKNNENTETKANEEKSNEIKDNENKDNKAEQEENKENKENKEEQEKNKENKEKQEKNKEKQEKNNENKDNKSKEMKANEEKKENKENENKDNKSKENIKNEEKNFENINNNDNKENKMSEEKKDNIEDKPKEEVKKESDKMEEANKEKHEKEKELQKEKAKPKRVRNAMKKLRGLDLE